MHVSVPAVETSKLISKNNNNSDKSEIIQKRVQNARDKQTQRFRKLKINSNSEMSTRAVKSFCSLSKDCHTMMISASATMNLSARSYFKVLKIARTISDLADEKEITTKHLAEALQYRPKIE